MFTEILKNIRLFAFDLDGTLLDSQKKFSPRTLDALKEISSLGFKIVFASGRIKSSMQQYTQLCPFPVSILSLNGAAVYLDQDHHFKKVYTASLFSEYADYLIRHTENNSITMNFYYNENLYVLLNETNLPWIELYTRQTGSKYHYLDSFQSFLGISPSKIIFVGPPEILDVQQRFFSDLWGDSVYICRTWKYYLEFLNPLANKGLGLSSIAEFFNLSMKNIVAFGDASNDVPMLENAGYGIALNNASQDAKKAADRVSPWTNDDDAIMHEWASLKTLLNRNG